MCIVNSWAMKTTTKNIYNFYSFNCVVKNTFSRESLKSHEIETLFLPPLLTLKTSILNKIKNKLNNLINMLEFSIKLMYGVLPNTSLLQESLALENLLLLLTSLLGEVRVLPNNF